MNTQEDDFTEQTSPIIDSVKKYWIENGTPEKSVRVTVTLNTASGNPDVSLEVLEF